MTANNLGKLGQVCKMCLKISLKFTAQDLERTQKLRGVYSGSWLAMLVWL